MLTENFKWKESELLKKGHLSVPCRDIWSQLAWQTRLAGCSFFFWNHVLLWYYFCAICFILTCEVQYIWVDSQVQRSGTLDLHLNLGQSKTSQAKLTAWEACKMSLASQRRGCLISLLWDQDQDEPLHSSTIDAKATQVCCIGQSSGRCL
jgi:hypothetical protein